MGFLDKAKEKAGKLVESTKDKVDDMKDKRKADDMLDDLGRIVYRQRTGRGEEGDENETARLVAVLQGLEADGTDGIVAKPEQPAAEAEEPAAEPDAEPAASIEPEPVVAVPTPPPLPPPAGSSPTPV